MHRAGGSQRGRTEGVSLRSAEPLTPAARDLVEREGQQIAGSAVRSTTTDLRNGPHTHTPSEMVSSRRNARIGDERRVRSSAAGGWAGADQWSGGTAAPAPAAFAPAEPALGIRTHKPLVLGQSGAEARRAISGRAGGSSTSDAGGRDSPRRQLSEDAALLRGGRPVRTSAVSRDTGWHGETRSDTQRKLLEGLS